MRIKFIVNGKTEDAYLLEGIAIYEKRLKHYCAYEQIIIPAVKANTLSPEQMKVKEGELILKQLENSDFLVLLDERGKQFTSLDFAGFIEKQQVASVKTMVFLVGGPFGFSDEVYKRANLKMSISKMTFSHQMIRLLFIEQLYRAYTIIKGEKYHHE
jgi:23S rRNA (pseudouridine1915-N3)-methyltransferase